MPVAMQMYPGNESEKPYIRKIVEEMKNRYKSPERRYKSPTKVLTVPEIFMLPRKRPMTDIFFPNPYMEEI